MGEFKITHKYVLDNDVRYLYSGTPLSMSYRGSPDYPNFDQLRISKENSSLKKSVLRSTEYEKNLDTFLMPKAPAFRRYVRNKIDPIVTRLLQPTIAFEGFRREKHRPKFRCKEYTDIPDKSRFASYKKVPEPKVSLIVSRLLKPTHMSFLKQRIPPPRLRQDPNWVPPSERVAIPMVDG